MRNNKQTNKDFVSINEYLDIINEDLSNHGACIIGEVTDIQMYPGRNYLFFKMKDKDVANPAVLTCMMWKNDYKISGVDIKDGLEIIISGTSSIYKPYGRFSFNVKTIELVGEGALKKQYEKLKAQLDKEGLFDISKKRPLPFLPQKIGLVTSKDGAVISDFQVNLEKFGFKILFIDSRVEGQLATQELLNSVRTLKNKDIEVLVLIRGGGSLESLLPFNNESLVREIADFPVPVIIGIGHEKDIPLVGLVADKMVSTPTAVASFLNKSWEQIEPILGGSEQKIFSKFQDTIQRNKDCVKDSLNTMRNVFQNIFNDFSRAQESLKIGLKSIKDQIVNIDKKIDGVLDPVYRKISFSISNIKKNISDSIIKEIFGKFLDAQNKIKESLVQYQKQITNNDPKRQLKLGYSIVMKNGKILKTTNQIKKGDVVNVGLSEGTFDSEVKIIKNN